MQGLGHEDVLLVLQLSGNEADAVPGERLKRSRPRHGLIPLRFSPSAGFVELAALRQPQTQLPPTAAMPGP